MHKATLILGCLCVLLLIGPIKGFYLPGVPMKEYKPGDIVELDVNKLNSVHTQLPYQYYSLPFCKPADNKKIKENLGELLRGDKIEHSVYEVKALESIECRPINYLPTVKNKDECTDHSKESLGKFEERIKQEYRVQWIMDNLPAAIAHASDGKAKKRYEIGFPLGDRDSVTKEPYVYNSIHIKIIYNHGKDTPTDIVIIGFEVTPYSVAYDTENWTNKTTKCPEAIHPQKVQFVTPPKDDTEKNRTIIWTYSVAWEKTEILWTERWDVYLQNSDAQIHWFSIINSLMIVLFLTGMVAMIMMRTLKADLRRYNQLEQSDEEGETGWKLVHGDVFRPPSHPQALAVLIGSGVQVFGMAIVTMICTVLGFLSPAQRGMLITAFVVLFVFMGVFAGYFSTRCYKIFRGPHWKKNTIATAFALPGVVFCIFFILNIVESEEKSTGAVSASTVLSLIALWFGISVPLVFFGSYFAYKKPLPEDPVRTNQIPRQIPEQVWYMSPILSVLMGGILPFGAVFIELFFILSALWGNQFYYIFGFLFIVFLILILTCAEITVVMCYFQLCAEDYHWWWRSFLTSGASAFYMFLYSIFYFVTTLEIEQFVSGLLYFGYTLIMTIAFFVLTGTIGFYACYYFVRKIYSSIHVD